MPALLASTTWCGTMTRGAAAESAVNEQAETPAQHERICPSCGNRFAAHVARCPDDGTLLSTQLVPRRRLSTLAGTTIDGRFYVGRLIGKGAMGRVYRGAELHGGRPVAIKVLRRKLWRDETLRIRFMREAKLIASFDHPNIVRLIDYGEQNQLLYMVMEYIDGVPLQRLMRGRPMAFDFALHVIDQIAAALVAAHAQNVVHRDAKPDNVFLLRGPDGRLAVKILDFGIAHVDRPMIGVDEDLTRDGMVFGTPEYMAPEQARGHTVDHATDLYALGVMLFEAVTGELPLQGRSAMETMLLQIKRPAPRASELAPDVPEPIARLIDDLLQKERNERIESATELRRRVAEVRGELRLGQLRLLPAGDLETALEKMHVRARTEEDDRTQLLPSEPEPAPRRAAVKRPPMRRLAARFDTSSPLFLLAVLVLGAALGIGAAALFVVMT